MFRQIIGYTPANVIPALVSVVMIYAYTRLMSPGAFGAYSFIFSAMLVLQASLFSALPIAVMRFYPGAVLSGRRDGLLREAYIVLCGMCAAVALIAVVAESFVPLPDEYREAAWLALPALLVRAVIQVNQAVNRSANRMARYNTVECLHSVLGFALGLIALQLWHKQTEAIVLGLLVSAIICACIDARLMASLFHTKTGVLNRAELLRLVAYAWPVVAVAAVAMILQNADRFLLGSLAGPETLGIFAVAYNLVDRPTTVICSSISTTTFPLAVQTLEHQGREAARIQAGRNGIALLALALPACVGLALTSNHIASCLIGPAFRPGVAALLPIMSFAALGRGVRSHFIDHAFHLSGRPLLMLWTYGPATVVNIALNLLIVPRYGMFGAAWTALASQIGIVIAGWFLGTSLFPVWLPFWQVVRCVLAVVPMTVALLLIPFPLNWFGLVAAILTGGALYAAAAIPLDVGGVRPLALRLLKRRRPVARKLPVLTDG